LTYKRSITILLPSFSLQL